MRDREQRSFSHSSVGRQSHQISFVVTRRHCSNRAAIREPDRADAELGKEIFGIEKGLGREGGVPDIPDLIFDLAVLVASAHYSAARDVPAEGRSPWSCPRLLENRCESQATLMIGIEP